MSIKLAHKYKIVFNNKEIDLSNLEEYENSRCDSLFTNELILHNNLIDIAVTYEEPFECCGKIYIHGFDHVLNASKFKTANENEEKYTAQAYEDLLNFCENLAQIQNYSYIGFVHILNSFACNAALHRGYTAIEFKNKRSGNILQEMYKIL